MNKKKSIAYRLNGAFERSDSYRSYVGAERVYINPSLAWQIDHNTSLIMEMDYFYDRRTPDLGTVNLAEEDVNAIYDLPYSQFLGYDNDRSITKNLTYSLRLNRRLNDKLSLKGAYYHSGLDLDDRGAGLGRAVIHDGSVQDRKSTRLNSSHVAISYAVFCLKKKKKSNKKKQQETYRT